MDPTGPPAASQSDFEGLSANETADLAKVEATQERNPKYAVPAIEMERPKDASGMARRSRSNRSAEDSRFGRRSVIIKQDAKPPQTKRKVTQTND